MKYFVTSYCSDIPSTETYYILQMKWVHWGYQNNDQAASLILKMASQNPGIRNFLIPDPENENSTMGLQS